MARSLDYPNIVDVMSCDLIGEMQLDIVSNIDSSCNIVRMPPIRCSVFYMKSELYLQVKLFHNEKSDMIEGYIKILSGWTENLKFTIKYGIRPYLEFTRNQQIFIFTATNRRSDNFPICKLANVIEYMLDNEVALGNQNIEFACTLTISVRNFRRIIPQYQIATVNARDANHKLLCQGLEIHTHRHILMGASKYFHRRLAAQPLFNVTNIDRLETSKQIEKEVLICLLRFMYGLYIHPHNIRTSNLLSAAREFEVNKLFLICEDALIKELCPGMAPELFYIGKTEKAPKLTYAAAKYILKNYKAVKERYEWDAIMLAFPKFFEPIKPNPLKYFREIIYPEIRSKSTGDLLTQTSVSFLLRSPEIVPTRPLSGKTADRTNVEVRVEPRRDEARRDSGDTTSASTLQEVDSMDFDTDMEPIRRKRSSPVITRRRSDTSALRDPYNMAALQAALPRPKFSRELLKKKLLENETASSSFSSSTSSLSTSSSFSDRDKAKPRLVAAVHDRYDTEEDADFKWNFYRKEFDVKMDCAEDSKLNESTDVSESPSKMGAAALPRKRLQNVSSESLASMRSLVFGEAYSYSTSSVFDRESPKSMSPPVEQMSVGSESLPTNRDRFPSPKAMKAIDFRDFEDFQAYTHPEARTLSDVSSLPLDSSSVEPESSSSSKARSRRAKRMKKLADRKRKFLPGAEPTIPYDFSSTQSLEPAGEEALPEQSSKVKSPKGKRHSPSQFHQKKGIRKVVPTSPADSSETTSSEPPIPQRHSKKVTFGSISKSPSYLKADEEFGDPELDDMKHYERWLDTASHYDMPIVFKESSSSKIQDIVAADKLLEKTWDEMDEEDLFIPLQQSEQAEPTSPADKQHDPETLQHSAPSTSSSYVEHKKFKKDSSPQSAVPLGGGVIRKTPRRLRMCSIDVPLPPSTSESFTDEYRSSTPFSSSSCERKKVRRTSESCQAKDDFKAKEALPEPSNLVRSHSFCDLRTIHYLPTDAQKRRKTPVLAGVSSIKLPDISQQGVQSTVLRIEHPKGDVENVESVDSSPMEDVEVPNFSSTDVEYKMEKDDQDDADVRDKDKESN